MGAQAEHDTVPPANPVVAAADVLYQHRHHLPADVLRTLAGVWSCASAARFGQPFERFWEWDDESGFYAQHDVAECEADGDPDERDEAA